MSDGVGVEFFCGAVKLLTKLHGNRMMGPSAEKFRLGLQLAEEGFLELPLAPKKSKRKKRK